MDLSILNWNVGGAKLFALPNSKGERDAFRSQLNADVKSLIQYLTPDVVTFQEVVQYTSESGDIGEIIDPIDNYQYVCSPLIDSDNLSTRSRWAHVRGEGGWPESAYFAQGLAMMYRSDLPHVSVTDLSAHPVATANDAAPAPFWIETVGLKSGLYLGTRDTEPRAAMVAHFVFSPLGPDGPPLDVFVVNLHLTTLLFEREGIPEIDKKATKTRMAQLNVIFDDVISPYNKWRQEGYLDRGKPRQWASYETEKRLPPVWFLAGDFNFTPRSVEYQHIMHLNFIDAVHNKGLGTKAKGRGQTPAMTLDYIFAGPKFVALDALVTEQAIVNNGPPITLKKSSDHYPLFATVPLAVESR